MLRVFVRSILLTVTVMGCLSAPRAAKLVLFHNGRVLQVQEVRQEDGWYHLTLGKGARIGVPERLIAEVQDADGKATPSIPNVQASAGGSSGGSTPRQVTRAPVARPAQPVAGGDGRSPAGGAMSQEDARDRAEALAQRGRSLGGDLRNLRRGAADPERAGRQPDEPAGIDLTGNQKAWPSPFPEADGARGGRRDDSPPPDRTEAEEAEEEDN